MASAFPDDDRKRHSTALMVVLDIFPQIMRDMICNNFPPNTVLVLMQNDPTFETNLHSMEKKMISNIRSNGYNSLDISLFYKIIRYFKLLPNPNQGWGKKPESGDINKEDDVERMKNLRNDVIHRPAGGLSELEISDFFRQSIEIAKRMDKIIGYPHNGFESKVEEIQSYTVTHEKYIKLLEKCVEYQARLQEIAGAPSFDLFYGKDIKIKIDAQGDHLASGGRTIACTLYLKDPDFDVNAVIQMLDVIQEYLSSGKFGVSLVDITSSSLILHVTMQDKCFMTKEILHKTVQSFLHAFFIGASIPFKLGHIYTVVLGESEYLVLDNQENNDLDYLRENTSPYVKLNVNVNDSAFQNEFTLYREVNSFVAGMYNAVDRQNVPLNGSSREVLMIVDNERAIDYTSRCEANRESQFRMAQVAVVSEMESNYFKISTLLLRISPRAVRIIFDDVFHPENLTDTLSSNLSKLTDLKYKRCINQTQWNSMFPRTDDPTSQSFDTTLMVCLLRNLAGIKIANTLPPAMDFSIGADLSRIKTYRKVIANSKDRTFKNEKFAAIWNETEAAVIRLSSGKLKKDCGTLKTKTYDVADIKKNRTLIQDSKRLVRIEEINEVTDRVEKYDFIQKSEAPQNFDIVESTDRSITVQWNKNNKDDCLDYALDHRPQGSADWKCLKISTTEVLTEENGYLIYELPDLLPETHYEFRMCYVKYHFKGQYTETMTQQTLISAPQDFNITECTDRSITVQWKINNQDDSLNYALDHRPQGSADWKCLPLSASQLFTEENEFRMYEHQDLLPDTNYEIRMCYVKNHFKGQYTEFKTKQTLKIAPQNFDIVECTDRSITIKWKYNYIEDYQHYELDHRPKGSADWKSLSLSSTDTSIKDNVFRLCKLQDLLPETYYELRMCSVDNRFKSQYTESKMQQTLKTVLPEAINRLPEGDRTRYHKLMQSSKTEKRHFVRIMIVGKKSAGKTCLLRRLLRESIDDVSSTDGVDIVVRRCKINIDDGKWTIDKDIDDDKVDRIKRAVIPNERMKRETTEFNQSNTQYMNVPDDEMYDSPVDVIPGLSGENMETVHFEFLNSKETISNPILSNVEVGNDTDVGSTVRNPVLNTKTPIETQIIEDATDERNTGHRDHLSNYVEEAGTDANEKLEENDEKSDSSSLVMPPDLMSHVFSKPTSNMSSNLYALCELWDFAGQKEFYATHQAFLTSDAVYLVVADMTDDICKQGISQCFADFQDVGEYVDFWFNSIHCQRTTTVAIKDHFNPPILLVFTGKDKYDQVHIEDRKDILDNQLDSVLGQQRKYHHLYEKFYLSNTEDLDDEFEKLRNAIYETAKKMDNWGNCFPLKWILCEHLIESNKENGKNFIDYTEMVHMAKHNDINIVKSDELLMFLRFQHNVGNIVFFESIPDLIILNPQWLADAFRCLVSDRVDSRLHHLEDWTLLTRYGKISESLISKLFDSKHGSHFSGQRVNLHKIMEELDILVKIEGSNSYIMPSKMPSYTFETVCMNIGIQNCRRTSWLCLKFEFLPPSFFNHLAAWFIRKYKPSKLNRNTSSLALYRGICIFDIDSNGSGCEKILVTMSTDTIALQILSFSSQQKELGNMCSEVFNDLKQMIIEMKERYQLKLSVYLHFKCSTGHYYKDTMLLKDLVRTNEFFCPDHTTTHRSEELYLPWMENEALIRLIPSIVKGECGNLKGRTYDVTDRENTYNSLQAVHIEKQIEEWEEESKWFARTNAFDFILKHLKERILTVVGNPGLGKSMLLHQTALFLRDTDGYSIFPCHRPSDIISQLKKHTKQVFILDDVCGHFTFVQSDVDRWKQNEKEIENNLINNNSVILASCRSQVFRESQCQSLFIFSRCVCDFNAGDCATTNQQKLEIADKYLSQKTISEIKQHIDDFDMFPLLCRLYNNGENGEAITFFQDPFNFYKEELDRFYKEDGGIRCCSLFLCVIHSGCLNQATLIEQSKSEFAHKIKSACSLLELTAEGIHQSLDTLLNTYLKKINDEYWVLNDRLFDFLCHYFGQRYQKLIINYADSNIIRDRTLCKSLHASPQDFTILIDSNFEDEYIERLIRDMLSGYIDNVIYNQQIHYEGFRLKLLSHIKELDVFGEFVLDANEKASQLGPLNFACKYEYTEWFEFFLSKTKDVNAIGGSSIPLITACRKGNQYMTKLLLDRGADVNLTDYLGCSPLLWSCVNGNLDIVQMLLNKNADIDNIENRSKSSPLIWACVGEYLHLLDSSFFKKKFCYNSCEFDEIISFLEENINKQFLSQEDQIDEFLYILQFGYSRGCSFKNNKLLKSKPPGSMSIWTKLIKTIRCQEKEFTIDVNNTLNQTLRFIEIMNVFLDRGFDIDKYSIGGITTLSFACFTNLNHSKSVTYLLSKGASVSICDIDGICPLDIAIKCQNDDLVKSLIGGGAIVNRPVGGHFPLKSTTLTKNISIIEGLKNDGANSNELDGVDTHNLVDVSPIMTAIDAQNISLVDILIKNGADINKRYESGMNLLHYAISYDNADLIYTLIKAGTLLNCEDDNGMTPLLCALTNGFANIVKILINEGAEVNTYNCHGILPITYAISSQSISLVDILIKHGADINKRIENGTGTTLLPFAIHFDNVDLIRTLIKAGIPVDDEDNQGMTPLMFAIEMGLANIVEALIDEGAEVNNYKSHMSPIMSAIYSQNISLVNILIKNGADIDKRYETGTTLLHFAVLQNNTDLLSLLIKAGIKVNCTNDCGMSPLMTAVEVRLADITKFLIEEGAEVDCSHVGGISPLVYASLKGDIDIVEIIYRAKQQFTTNEITNSVFSACKNNHKEVVSLLLQKGYDINIHDSKNGNTCLLEASDRGLESMVSLLLEQGANVDASNCAEDTPLTVASLKGHTTIVRLLLVEGKADMYKSNKNGESSPILACLHNHLEVVKVLIDNGCNIDSIEMKTKQTCLSVASSKGFDKIVAYLIAHGANVNAQSNIGTTPLMLAASKGYLNIVKTLIEHTADVNIQSKNGSTCLLVASSKGFDNIVTYFIDHRASINTANKTGDTPLMLASKNGHASIVKILLENGAKVDIKNKEDLSSLDLVRKHKHPEIEEILCRFMESTAD